MDNFVYIHFTRWKSIFRSDDAKKNAATEIENGFAEKTRFIEKRQGAEALELFQGGLQGAVAFKRLSFLLRRA